MLFFFDDSSKLCLGGSGVSTEKLFMRMFSFRRLLRELPGEVGNWPVEKGVMEIIIIIVIIIIYKLYKDVCLGCLVNKYFFSV